jgi:hypothetical protein
VGNSDKHQDEYLTEEEAENVFGIFCVKYGFCLSWESYERLYDAPPKSARSYVDSTISEYGLDPETVDPHMHREMQEVVEQAAQRCRTARGGLPPNTSLEGTRER